jgi:hypothetical protein
MIATNKGIYVVLGGGTVRQDTVVVVVVVWTVNASNCRATSQHYGFYPVDPQDLAIGSGGALWIADIGAGVGSCTSGPAHVPCRSLTENVLAHDRTQPSCGSGRAASTRRARAGRQGRALPSRPGATPSRAGPDSPRRSVPVSSGASRSNRAGQFGECCGDPLRGGCVGGEFVVPQRPLPEHSD